MSTTTTTPGVAWAVQHRSDSYDGAVYLTSDILPTEDAARARMAERRAGRGGDWRDQRDGWQNDDWRVLRLVADPDACRGRALWGVFVYESSDAPGRRVAVARTRADAERLCDRLRHRPEFAHLFPADGDDGDGWILDPLKDGRADVLNGDGRAFVCRHCGSISLIKGWSPQETHRVFCPDNCAGAVAVIRQRLRREDARRKFCRTCRKGFIARRSDGHYCSPACRQKAYRDRKRVTDDESTTVTSSSSVTVGLCRGGAVEMC